MTVTPIAADEPPLPVTVKLQEPAATGVTVNVPVVVAGAVAIATPLDTQVDTLNPPALLRCATVTFCALLAPTAVNESTAGETLTAAPPEIGVGDPEPGVDEGLGDETPIGEGLLTGPTGELPPALPPPPPPPQATKPKHAAANAGASKPSRPPR